MLTSKTCRRRPTTSGLCSGVGIAWRPPQASPLLTHTDMARLLQVQQWKKKGAPQLSAATTCGQLCRSCRVCRLRVKCEDLLLTCCENLGRVFGTSSLGPKNCYNLQIAPAQATGFASLLTWQGSSSGTLVWLLCWEKSPGRANARSAEAPC